MWSEDLECHLLHLYMIFGDLVQTAFENSTTYFSLCGVPDVFHIGKQNMSKISHYTFLCMVNFLHLSIQIIPITLILHLGPNKNIYLQIPFEPDLSLSTRTKTASSAVKSSGMKIEQSWKLSTNWKLEGVEEEEEEHIIQVQGKQQCGVYGLMVIIFKWGFKLPPFESERLDYLWFIIIIYDFRAQDHCSQIHTETNHCEKCGAFSRTTKFRKFRPTLIIFKYFFMEAWTR